MEKILRNLGVLAISLAAALLTGVTSGALSVVVLYYQFHDWYRERYNLPVGEDGGGHEGFEFLMLGLALFSVTFVVTSLLSGVLVWRKMRRHIDRSGLKTSGTEQPTTSLE